MGPRNKGSVTRCTTLGRTPLSDIFRGQLRSRVYRQGQESTDNVQPFFTLQLDIEVIFFNLPLFPIENFVYSGFIIQIDLDI